MDTPYDPAPAPPPGPALLDDNESNMLDNFFTTMNSVQFDSNDFWLRLPQSKSLSGGPLSFDWSNELPPTFEGSTASLPQSTVPGHGLEKEAVDVLRGHVGADTDLFAAASMLYQNGGSGNHFGATALPRAGSSVTPHAHDVQCSHTPASQKECDSGSTRPRLPVGVHTTEMMFDLRSATNEEQRPSTKPRTLHWGSDMSFMSQGYMAPPDQPNEEERTKDLLKKLDCLEPQTSATNTRAPSPERPVGVVLSGTRRSVDDGSQPKKRPKISVKEETDGVAAAEAAAAAAARLGGDDSSDGDVLDRSRPKTRKSKARRGSSDRPRSKSQTGQCGAKPVRENLTEEQKRTNHILSEQKRRNLIRQGFDDLCALVPGLRGGGFSKSAMLTEAANWLEEMLRGNEILRAQLAEMSGVNGMVMPR